MRQTNPLKFRSNRRDGLGARLMGIVGAKAFANRYGGDFDFEWPAIKQSVESFHAIETPLDTFDDAFVSEFFRAAQSEQDIDAFLDVIDDPAPTGTYIAPVIKTLDQFGDRLVRADLHAAFWELRFSDKINRAIEAAQGVELSAGTKGLHLRAGDIIYGRFRHTTRFMNKVVPYPLGLHRMQEDKAAGIDTVVFGEDPVLCRALCKAAGTIFAGDFHAAHKFDNQQATVFDMVLMSRCATLCAGQSNMAYLAQIIGDTRLITPEDMEDEATASAVLRAHLLTQENSDPLPASPQQRAFCCMFAIHHYHSSFSNQERITLMQDALRYDPHNGLYVIVLAGELFLAGQGEAAEALLATHLTTYHADAHEGGLVLVLHKIRDHQRELHARYLDLLADLGAQFGGIAEAFSKALDPVAEDFAPLFDLLYQSHTTAGPLPEQLLALRFGPSRVPLGKRIEKRADRDKEERRKTALKNRNAQVEKLKADLKKARSRREAAVKEKKRLEAAIVQIEASLSWRVTAPLRRVSGLFRR